MTPELQDAFYSLTQDNRGREIIKYLEDRKLKLMEENADNTEHKLLLRTNGKIKEVKNTLKLINDAVEAQKKPKHATTNVF